MEKQNDNVSLECTKLDETDEIAGTLDEGPGISDIGLETIVKSSDAFKSCLDGTNNGYDIELLNLFLITEGYLKLLKNKKQKKELDEKEFKNEKKMLLHKLVSKIGVLSKYFERDNYSAKTEDREVLGRMDIPFKLGKNCNLVPGCLPNLNKLVELKIIDEKNINIEIGDGVNLQESISFVKTSGALGSFVSGKFEKSDKLERISIKTGRNCSLAHGTSSYHGDRNDIEITAGNGVFFGINTLIGSGSWIGDNSTIWWGSQLGNDVKLGSNIIIGQSSIIESGVKIPDNCLVPNFSKIGKGLTKDNIISYEEYENNPNKFVRKRNFVISLSENENEKNKQLEFINSHYNFIDGFNKHNVVPENKIFAEIDTVFSFLKDTIGFEDTKIFKYKTNITKLKTKLGENGITKNTTDKLNFGADGQSRVILKAFPKNSDAFLLEEMPVILNEIDEYIINGTLDQKKDYLLRKIEGLIDRPTINENDLENHFFGDCYITGKFKYTGDCTFIDLKSRGDELKTSESIVIDNSVFVRGTIHGGGDKIISSSKVYDLVAHGSVTYNDSSIGEIGKRSVLNGSNVTNSTILGDATINGADIIDSNLSSEVSIAGGNGKDRVIIKNSEIEKGVCINTGTEIYGCKGKDKILSGKKLGIYLIVTPEDIAGKR